MCHIRAIKAAALACSLIGGVGLWSGCGGSTPPTGTVVQEDMKATQDREKLISEQYKNKAPGAQKPR